MDTLERGALLGMHSKTPSDINEHLQFIHDTALECRARAAVELGVRFGESTVALLIALEKTDGRLYSCDISDYPETRARVASHGLDGRWEFTVSDDLAWGKQWKRPIDLLLIDSSHERAHTEEELRLFAPWIRLGGVILLHDTVSRDTEVLGALRAFLRSDPCWTFQNRPNNNGLGVLRRRSGPEVMYRLLHACRWAWADCCRVARRGWRRVERNRK